MDTSFIVARLPTREGGTSVTDPTVTGRCGAGPFEPAGVAHCRLAPRGSRASRATMDRPATARTERQQLAFLLEASALFSQALDPRELFDGVPRLVVPALADL